MSGAQACHLTQHSMRLARVFTLCIGPCSLLVTSVTSTGHYLLKEILCYARPSSVVSVNRNSLNEGEAGAINVHVPGSRALLCGGACES